jgi:microcompartment protein CcmK/EutM
MLLARIVGRVDAAQRLAALAPCRLDLVETVDASGAGTGRRYVAVDTLGAAPGSLVVTASAAAARMVATLADSPVDLAVIAVLDQPGIGAA